MDLLQNCTVALNTNAEMDAMFGSHKPCTVVQRPKPSGGYNVLYILETRLWLTNNLLGFTGLCVSNTSYNNLKRKPALLVRDRELCQLGTIDVT